MKKEKEKLTTDVTLVLSPERHIIQTMRYIRCLLAKIRTAFKYMDIHFKNVLQEEITKRSKRNLKS